VKKYPVFLVHLFCGTVGTLTFGALVHSAVLKIYWLVSGIARQINFDILTFIPAFLCAGMILG
jgi:ammonia channel protein AmtB